MGESYAAAIGKNAPQNGASLLRARVSSGDQTAQQLSAWLNDYALLQTKQAQELERFLAKHVISEEKLGTLAEPWQKIVLVLIEQSRLNNDTSRKIQTEVEKPLRDLAATHKPQAEEILKQYDNSKPLPNVAIEGIQHLDEIRLSTAKSALVRFSSILVDQHQSLTKSGERAMQAWLGFEVQDDVDAYVAQVVSGVAKTENAKAVSIASQRVHSSASSSALPSSRQSSQASDSTVRRKSSFLGFETKSPGGLRSKVGSIFGRKKKKSPTAMASVDSFPKIGRKNSEVSVNSSVSQGSLRQQRMRQHTPGTPKNKVASGSYASPLRVPHQNDYNAETSGLQAPLGVPNGASTPTLPQTQKSLPPEPAAKSNINTDLPAAFGAPAATNAPAATSSAPFTLQADPAVNSPVYSGQNTATNGSTSGIPNPAVSSPATSTVPPFLAPVPQDHTAPPPPPARSVYRQNSLGRSASTNSRTRSTRESRVGSQIFADLPPTTTADHDTFAPLPEVLATPQQPHVNGQNSPEQFYTPAQRFVHQFEHSNTSVASISNNKASNFPPLPAGEGLVATAIEHVYAKYVGENLVESSVKGEALAQIRGPAPADSTQDHIVLGVLLADGSAHLTPSALLRQTSNLSFEVPYTSYFTEQDLVQYHSDTAVGRVPIRIIPQWRFDTKTVRLVLSFQLSELYVGGDQVEVNDLLIAVTLGATTGRAQSAQSKPVATFSREKQRVTWRFNQPQVLTRGGPPTKLLCQFVTDGPVTTPGSIELKAKIPKVTNSLLQLRTLSPSGEWIAVPTSVCSDVHQRNANE